jgi:hypothetical protein
MPIDMDIRLWSIHRTTLKAIVTHDGTKSRRYKRFWTHCRYGNMHGHALDTPLFVVLEQNRRMDFVLACTRHGIPPSSAKFKSKRDISLEIRQRWPASSIYCEFTPTFHIFVRIFRFRTKSLVPYLVWVVWNTDYKSMAQPDAWLGTIHTMPLLKLSIFTDSGHSDTWLKNKKLYMFSLCSFFLKSNHSMHAHAHMHTHIRIMRVRVCLYVCVLHAYTHTQTHAYTCIHVEKTKWILTCKDDHKSTLLLVCAYIYAYMYVCMYVCMHTYLTRFLAWFPNRRGLRAQTQEVRVYVWMYACMCPKKMFCYLLYMHTHIFAGYVCIYVCMFVLYVCMYYVRMHVPYRTVKVAIHAHVATQYFQILNSKRINYLNRCVKLIFYTHMH